MRKNKPVLVFAYSARSLIYHTQRGGSTAEPIPPVSGQVHPNTVQLRIPHQERGGKKGRKEDKEAVQMAYSSHQQKSEPKDTPHDREHNGKWVARQGLPPDGYGIAARGDQAEHDRRAFGHLPDVGNTRTKNEYGDHHLLADRFASLSQFVSAPGV